MGMRIIVAGEFSFAQSEGNGDKSKTMGRLSFRVKQLCAGTVCQEREIVGRLDTF